MHKEKKKAHNRPRPPSSLAASPLLLLLLALLVLLIQSLAHCGGGVLGHGELTDPLPRTTGDNHVVDEPPCGPVSKGSSVAEYDEGSEITVSWRVDILHEGSEASFYLLDTNADNPDTVYTLAENVPFDKVTDYETVLRLPEGVVCSNCTLQWVFRSVAEEVTIFNCADIDIVRRRQQGGGGGGNTDDDDDDDDSGGSGGGGDSDGEGSSSAGGSLHVSAAPVALAGGILLALVVEMWF